MAWHDELREPVKDTTYPGELTALYKAILQNIAINSPPPPKPPPKPRGCYSNPFLQPEGMAEREPSWRLDPDR